MSGELVAAAPGQARWSVSTFSSSVCISLIASLPRRWRQERAVPETEKEAETFPSVLRGGGVELSTKRPRCGLVSSSASGNRLRVATPADKHLPLWIGWWKLLLKRPENRILGLLNLVSSCFC